MEACAQCCRLQVDGRVLFTASSPCDVHSSAAEALSGCKMSVLWSVLLLTVSASRNTDAVEFQLNELDSPVLSVLFCGTDKDVLLALTHKRTVYRSENLGFSWRPLQTILQREGLSQVSSDREIGQVTTLKLSPVDPRLVVMLGSKGINWFTDDCGKSVWALNYGKPIYEFQFHPLQRDWGLAASWTVCDEASTEPCDVYKELYVTKNLRDWSFVTDYVLQFTWAQDNLETFLQRRTPNDRILVTYLPNASGHQSIKGWTHRADLVRSDDYFKSVTTLVPRGNKFIVSSRYVLVAQVVEEGATEVQLLTSWERNLEQFTTAELPIKNIGDHSYTLLDTSEETIFLYVNHEGPGAQFGNVYISDVTGRRFSTSLLRVAQGPEGICDFDKVYGLEGIYIANVVDKESVPTAPSPQKKGRKGQKAEKEPEEIAQKKTVITFDKGSIWRSIPAPDRDSSGKRVLCADENCSLHLHSLSHRLFTPVYSTESAVGLILATGNVGEFLSTREDEINSYMSRDGGLTWFEVRAGSHTYEMGDHGALIVMARNREATDTVYYTWNEGLTWQSLKVAEGPVQVENVVIAPGAISQQFLVLAEKKGKGVVIALDFSSLHEPQCKSDDKPDSSDSDYELWTPNDGRAGSKCLMGRTVVYQRRKREAECYNGLEFDRSSFKEPCTCTEDDYECDLGYIREGSGPCRPIPGEDLHPQQCLPGEEFYEVPTGYRRVAGDTCSGGISAQYEPTRVFCSSADFAQSKSLALVMLGFVCVVYGIYTGWSGIIAGYQRLVAKHSEPKYSRDFGQFPDTVDDDMVVREPAGLPLDDFNPRN